MSAAAVNPSPAKSAALLLDCAICAKSHAQKYKNCPSLKLIQRKKAELPATCCAKCLGLLDETGQCLKGAECHLVTTRSGVQYNFLCKEHKEVHFRICTSCPPSKKKAEVIGQRVALRSRETSYPCTGIRDPQTRSSLAFKATDAETDDHLVSSQVWPPEASPLSTTEDSQPFLLGLIAWRHNVQEIRDVICAPNQSTSAGQLQVAGCLRCCPIAKELAQINRNDVLLDGQLSFSLDPATQNKTGRFKLHRLHNHLIKMLPTGEPNSKGCTYSLIEKLKRYPCTAQMLNDKLKQEFAEHKSRWVKPGELASWEKSSGLTGHFMSPVLVINLKSSSSPVRLCINPAVRHKILDSLDAKDVGSLTLTYNDTVFTYTGDLITPDLFAMFQSCGLMICAADIKAAFRQIALDMDSQFRSIVLRLKDREGNPSLTESECHSRDLHMLLETVASFGQSDLPALLGACVKKAAMRFHSLASKQEKAQIHPVIFKQTSFVLAKLTYLDDLPIVSSLHDIQEWKAATK